MLTTDIVKAEVVKYPTIMTMLWLQSGSVMRVMVLKGQTGSKLGSGSYKELGKQFSSLTQLS